MTHSPKSSRNQIASLPPELINCTAVFAARQEVYTNRAWVVQLALVGYDVFRTVRPILYADLIITSHNVTKVSSIPSLHERVLQYVRRITSVQLHRLRFSVVDPRECLDAILREWQPQPESYIQVPWTSLKKLLIRLPADNVNAVSGTQSQLTRLDISSIAFDNLCLDHSAGIPLSIAQNITHISGFMPPAWGTANVNNGLRTPRSWAHAIIDALPSLTHLGLVALKYANGIMSHGYLGRGDNFAELGTAIQAMLDRRDTLFVTLRAVGEYTVVRQHWSEGSVSYGLLLHTRLTLWIDERSISRHVTAEALVVDDAWRGRNIWSGPPDIDSGLELDALFGCSNE